MQKYRVIAAFKVYGYTFIEAESEEAAIDEANALDTGDFDIAPLDMQVVDPADLDIEEWEF